MAGQDVLAVSRMIDASSNRAAEGLRTVEEYCRFVLEDRFLSEFAKQLRHDLRAAIAVLGVKDLLTARSVASDCGTTITTASEQQRADVLAVVRVAASRVQEALRCIEEYSKTIKGFDAGKIEAIRYRAYTLFAATILMPPRRERLADARLYLLMPTDADEAAFAARVEAMFRVGVDIIQLRDKMANDRSLYRCSRIASDIARRLGAIFIVNDRADIAAATAASGVHVGQDELPVEAARRIVGPDALIGVSTHDLVQARAALIDGADYIGCGPTFASRTKSFDDFPGLPFLRSVASEMTLPAYGIGGIDETNVDDVIGTGIHGAAVSSAILMASDPMAAASLLKARFGAVSAG